MQEPHFMNNQKISDVYKRQGRDMNIRAFLSYIEVTGGKNMMEDSVLGKMLNRLDTDVYKRQGSCR